jgi:hypothetical protein
MLYDLSSRRSPIRVHAPRAGRRFALALGAAPIGVFLMLRRMSLIGDAMAHAILPAPRSASCSRASACSQWRPAG